jgi:hypothetical protein
VQRYEISSLKNYVRQACCILHKDGAESPVGVLLQDRIKKQADKPHVDPRSAVSYFIA